MRVRIVFSILVLACIAFAQSPFTALETNFDGSMLWFSSPLRMKGTDQFPHPKIFVWDSANGVRLYDQKPASIVPGVGSYTSGPYKLIAASASSDGKTVAVTGFSDCNFGTPCAFSVERYASEIRLPAGEPLNIAGSAVLSPNGEFAYVSRWVKPVIGRAGYRAIQIRTGLQMLFDEFPRTAGQRHKIANDGTVAAGNRIISFPSGAEELLNAFEFTISAIDASGTRVVYTRPGADRQPRLVAREIRTGRETEIAPFYGGEIDISDDASTVAYLESGDVWIVHFDGSGKRRVTDRSTPTDFVLSGDGSSLFVATVTGQILRFDLRTSTVRVIIPATFYSPRDSPLRDLGRGGTYEFMEPFLSPFVESVRILGKSQPIIALQPGRVVFQVPWDMPDGNSWTELVLRGRSTGPFEESIIHSPVRVGAYGPELYRAGNYIAALHQDFSGPVSASSPAAPGEVIHLYGTGFGPVMPEIQTGEPARADPLSTVTEPITCYLRDSAGTYEPADVVFGGLAPGLTGVYQIDVRIPEVLQSGEGSLFCSVLNRYLAGGALPVAPRQ